MPRNAYAGVYETMDFPRYEFHEYPKAIKVLGEDGKTRVVVVANQKEEVEAISFASQPTPTAASAELDLVVAELSKEQDLRAELEAQLAELRGKMALNSGVTAQTVAKPTGNKFETLKNGG